MLLTFLLRVYTRQQIFYSLNPVLFFTVNRFGYGNLTVWTGHNFARTAVLGNKMNDESAGRVKLILNLVSYYISSENLINFIENLNLLIGILNLAFLVIVFFTARCLCYGL